MFVAIGLYRGMFFKETVDIANIGVGFLIMGLVMALGGPTGPALNPARDFGPRLLYSILPIPNKKGGAHWSYGPGEQQASREREGDAAGAWRVIGGCTEENLVRREYVKSIKTKETPRAHTGRCKMPISKANSHL